MPQPGSLLTSLRHSPHPPGLFPRLGTGWFCTHSITLTTAKAGHSQGLGCVQSQAVLVILDVGHDWHGIEVGLEWQFLQVLPGLDLRDRQTCWWLLRGAGGVV